MYKLFSSIRVRYAMVVASVTALALAGASSALATESATAEKVKTIASTVSSEGVEIILAVLAALAALIAAVIIIPKAIGFIRRFI